MVAKERLDLLMAAHSGGGQVPSEETSFKQLFVKLFQEHGDQLHSPWSDPPHPYP